MTKTLLNLRGFVIEVTFFLIIALQKSVVCPYTDITIGSQYDLFKSIHQRLI